MTVFGVIWLALIIVAFFKKDIRYLACLTLIGMVFQCNNVIEFSVLTCGPQIITSFVFIVKSFTYKSSSEPERTSRRTGIVRINTLLAPIAFLAFYIPIHSLLFFSEQFSNIVLSVVQLITYIVCFFRFRKLAPMMDKDFLHKCINILMVIIVGVGVIQLIIEGLHLPKNTIIAHLFYNDSSNTNICYYNKNVFRMYSTFMEPSYCASVLVGFFFYVYVNPKKYLQKTRYMLLVILMGCILLTQSSTAYGAFALLLALHIVTNLNQKNTWALTVLGMVTLIFLVLATDILDTVVFDKVNSSSFLVRSRFNENAMNAFRSSLLIGIGYKGQRGSSIVPTLLGELGIIGFTPYMLFVWVIIMKIIKKKESPQAIGIIYFVAAALCSQIIACPDLDLCSFWLAMYLMALSMRMWDPYVLSSKIK